MYPSSAALGKMNVSIILPSLARTVDTLYIGCEKFPYRDAFALSVSGVS